MKIDSNNEVVKILVVRDGISIDEAIEKVEELQAEINHAICEGQTLCELESIVEDMVGLEPDFLMDFLG